MTTPASTAPGSAPSDARTHADTPTGAPAVDPTLARADLRRPATRSTLTPERLAAPARTDRPGIRWWWQSPVPTGELLDELRAIAAAGFGEVEIAFSPEFWATDAQRDALKAVLDEARTLDVGVAMTLGAAWPLQTPNTTRGTRYAAQELQYGVTWIEDGAGTNVTRPDAANACATGTDGADAGVSGTDVAAQTADYILLPAPRPFDDPDGERGGTLLAVVAARVIERGTEPQVVPSDNPWGKPTKIIPPLRSTRIDESTLTVLATHDADTPTPTLRWEGAEGSWALIALWVRDSEQGVTSFLDADAARAALAYLDDHQIGAAAATLDAPDSTATELFEDSLELNADCLFWSPTLRERFIAYHGYDPTPYLPLMIAHGQCRYWVPEEPPRPDFAPVKADGTPSDLGLRVRADYDRLITELYTTDHLALIQDWALGHGMRHKAQAAYGQNLEPVRSFRDLVRCGGRAEVESLNSGDRVPIRMSHPNWRFALDWQRSAIGGAHQGGATRISTELGAQMDKCYDFSLADYRQMLDKEWAVGVTKPFVHGFATQASDAPWPTQGRFGTVVSESWNHRHFPQWDAWKALTDYWARGTAVLETGVPRTDVAWYRDGFLTTAARGNDEADAGAPDLLINAEPLERHGYSVQILDPIGLAEDGIVGTDAEGTPVLFPHGPAYRALILDTPTLTPEAARAAADAAEAGVALVVVGPPPARDTGWGGRECSEQVAADVARALAGPRVAHVEAWEDMPTALARLGVFPRVRWDGPILLTQVRDADEGRYILVYNPSEAGPVTLPLDLDGEGGVDVIDLDTGICHPVCADVVEAHDGSGAKRTRVRMALAARGLVVVLLRADAERGSDAGGAAGSQSERARCVRVAGAVVGTQPEPTEPTEAADISRPAGVETLNSGAPGASALLSTPGVVRDDAEAGSFTLTWGTLTVTAEESDGVRDIVLPAQGPADWRTLPALEHVSGVGRYTLTLGAAHDGAEAGTLTPERLAGAHLCLGAIGGIAVVRIGGRDVATVMRDDVVIPVGDALAREVAAGRAAAVEIEVRTTLRNVTLAADVYMKGPWAVTYPTVPHGLLGPVVVA